MIRACRVNGGYKCQESPHSQGSKSRGCSKSPKSWRQIGTWRSSFGPKRSPARVEMVLSSIEKPQCMRACHHHVTVVLETARISFSGSPSSSRLVKSWLMLVIEMSLPVPGPAKVEPRCQILVQNEI